ncbi:YdcF family protein [Microaceticoccus formicicus]|uniref:YdcF family protein n=1 Tax=Microaceticoccus formicicus TaxID=3118105 RepID=UPI003CCFFA58|nr:YdcF family protein [Peptoniphilaceae bacterium AMB_02]
MRNIKELTDFIFMENELKASDLIMLPGSRSIETIELAASIYKEGLAPYILASGAFSKDVGRFEWEKIRRNEYKKDFKTEYEFMKHGLQLNGVPESTILKEDTATYTYQNALRSKEMLVKEGIKHDRIILCVKDYHARRSFMYFDMVFPDSEILIAPAYIEVASKDHWMKSELGIRVITGEMRKIGEQFYDLYLDHFNLKK